MMNEPKPLVAAALPGTAVDWIGRIRGTARSFLPGLEVTIDSDFEAGEEALLRFCGPCNQGTLTPAPIPLRAFVAELCFNSVNYSYWGASPIEPGCGNSLTVRRRIFAGFGLDAYPNESWPDEDADIPDREIARCIGQIAIEMQGLALPLAAERVGHIREVGSGLAAARRMWARCVAGRTDARDFDLLMRSFPGFAVDPFAKRALLFFMLLARVYGRCREFASTLPLPSDYQIPRVLRSAGILTYSTRLARMVDAGAEIACGSRMEMEIRAAAMLAVEGMARQMGTTEDALDGWLWMSRGGASGAHHRTRTVFY